jgi:hypothetical protein
MGLSLRRLPRLLTESINGIQISASAGIDHIGTGSLSGYQTTSTEIAFNRHLPKGVLSAGHRLYQIFDQMAALVKDPIDGLHGGIDCAVSGS